MPTKQRVVYWRNLATPGGEQCTLMMVPTGYQLFGTALWVDGDQANRARYRVVCDARWRTRSVDVDWSPGVGERRLLIVVDAGGRWRIRGEELTAMRGCLDVDIGCTPATNTLPIQRLALGVGAAAELHAAWVRFPELAVARVRQRYTRLDKYRYRYENLDNGFTAVLDVDEWGLVAQYEGGWACEAAY